MFGAGIVTEVADMYKNPLAFARETAANPYDQLQYFADKDKNKKVVIDFYVDKLRKKIYVVDSMTGIVEMNSFLIIGTTSTSRATGKIVGTSVSSYENINPNIIGQKHFGKLSCLYASKSGDVEYYSNNGKNGNYLHMDYEGWQRFEYDLPFQTIDKADALEHVGLKVVINDVKEECLNIKRLAKELSKWFAILLSKHKIQINIHDVNRNYKLTQVFKPEGFSTTGETTDDTLATTKGGNIRVNLIQTDQPSLSHNVDVYQKEVYVCSIKVPFLCKGYVNYDGLELPPNRESYKDHAEFTEKFDHYLLLHFPREYLPEPEEHIKPKDEQQLKQVITEVFTAISHLNPDLLPAIIGFSTSIGIPGTPMTKPKEKSKDYETKENMKYTDEEKEDDTPTITCGTGTGGGGGGGGHKTVEEGGIHTVKKPITPKDDPKGEPQLVMPNLEVVDTPMQDVPFTLVFKELPLPSGAKKLILCINSLMPASRVLRRTKGLSQQRDVFYDKLIRAAYRMTFDPARGIEEFEKKVDETWNCLYSTNQIQQQAQLMQSETK